VRCGWYGVGRGWQGGLGDRAAFVAEAARAAGDSWVTGAARHARAVRTMGAEEL
jgi:hypothetical protein